ncbi:MAG: EAL domain-containing protein [Clostridia bacterium]|nr:EAL domain-containing protein [Clostridia bacterium]
MEKLLEQKKGILKKILIVDDEFIERAMLGAMLNDIYEVIYAENGAVALDIIKTSQQAFSLILLDLHMPELDGYQFLKIIRSDSKLRRIPVIVLTAEKGSEVECLQMGAADFITKPYDVPEIIRARISRSIELAEDSIIIHETEKDELTGLYNVEFFFEYGKRLDEQLYIPMDAVVLDINRFHIVNELYGRDYGDCILQKISNSIQYIIQNTVGLACRSGSNSFYMYIPSDKNVKENIEAYTEQINKAIGDNKISLRIGIYTDDGSKFDIETKFDRARLVCRQLQDNYGTCFGFYNNEINDQEVYFERLINDIDRAIEEKQFKVFYQPKYNIRGNKPVLSSAEALIRWVHPEYGMINPNIFTAVFERSGMIYKIDRYVWNEVAAQIRKWQKAFGVALPVSVNVSRVDIFNPMLTKELCDIILKNGISRDMLLLEITESAYTENLEHIVDTLNDLRSKGFKIEMDDFGSGYSSLNMLTSMPVDALKLDMSFIKNICTDEKAYRLVGIVIDIANLLEVPAVAEGVETKEQMEKLKELGCYIIQGYYFSKPLPPDELEKMLEPTKEGK